MRAALVRSVAQALADRANAGLVDATRRQAIVVQEVEHIRVRPPPGCPPTDLVVTQRAGIVTGDPVQTLLDLSRDVVGDVVAAAAEAEIRRQGWPAFALGPPSRAEVARAVGAASGTLVQQDVGIHQTVRYVTAQTCGLAITNDAAVQVAAGRRPGAPHATRSRRPPPMR